MVAQFEIPYYQILNEKSVLVDDLPEFAKDSAHLLRLYYFMALNRAFDNKAVALQRTGKLGTYPSARGQEAVFVGIGDALRKEDLFVPYYRDVATLLQRGVGLNEILLYWGGDERGNCFANGGDDFPYCVPIGTQLLHAAGAATAIKIRGENRVVAVTCGDGATSQGDFYEAINLAGIWKLPIVFIVCNNQWAISVSREVQTAAQTLAQKAIAAGFPGEQVDGNDVIAVRHRVSSALEKARNVSEPTLLEIISYRHADHTTADDASRYEPNHLRETEWKKEPLKRLQDYLISINAWSETLEKKCQEDCALEVEKAVKLYLEIEPHLPDVMMKYLYASLPDAYANQYAELKRLGESTHD